MVGSMCIAVRELRIIRRWKQKVAPVLGKGGQAVIALCHLLHHFLAQEATKARAGLGKLLRRFWWIGVPLQEIRNQRAQRFRRLELGAGDFNVALEGDDLSLQFAIPPQAEAVAIGIKEIGQRFELFPLLSVVTVFLEFSRVGALARRFHFDEANKRVVHRNGEIRTRLKMFDCRFADEMEGLGRQAVDLGQIVEEAFQRVAELVFWRAFCCHVFQLGFRRFAEIRNGGHECFAGQVCPKMLAAESDKTTNRRHRRLRQKVGQDGRRRSPVKGTG
jgi:hypothetical protein